MGSSEIPARKGRLLQRYDNQYRLVSGCIPFRINQNISHGDDLKDRLEVLMISSPNRHDLIFPKGGWENDETEEEAACREAYEEAGVRGIIRGSLGVWYFRSKSSQKSSSGKAACRGSLFALEVKEELPSWPQEACYGRRWLNVSDAWELCRYDWMREALSECMKLLSADDAALPADGGDEPPIFWELRSSEAECLESPINTVSLISTLRADNTIGWPIGTSLCARDSLCAITN